MSATRIIAAWLFLCGLTIFAPGAWALDKTGVGLTTVPGGGSVQATSAANPLDRSYLTGATSGEARVMESFRTANPGGTAWSGTATRTFPWASVAKAAVAGAKIAAGVASAVYVAQGLADVYCYFTNSSGFMCAPQTLPTEQSGLEYRYYPSGYPQGEWNQSQAAACAASPKPGPTNWSGPAFINPPGECRWFHTSGAYLDYGVGTRTATTYGCAQQGFTLVGTVCYKTDPAQREATPDANVEDRLASSTAAKGRAKDLLQEAVEKLGINVPESAPLVVNGPATTSKPTSTTTGPNGTTTTTTTYGHTYANNTYAYTTNVTVNNNGTVTSTTTEGATPEESVDPCVKNPGTIGCAKMDIPEAPAFTGTDTPVSVTPDSGWGPDTASCPAPAVIPISRGGSLTMSYQPYCDFMGGIRPVILGLAWLSAAFIFMGYRKAGDD